MSTAGRRPWGLTAQPEKGDAEIPSPEPRDTRTRVVMVLCSQGKITQEARQIYGHKMRTRAGKTWTLSSLRSSMDRMTTVFLISQVSC